MRRFTSIFKATIIEIASDPLSLLLTVGSIAMALLAPLLHCHQFGESSRMAREASFSALLAGGILQAVFCSIKTMRREIEQGTAEMALAHSISPARFFTAKAFGAAFFSIIFSVTLSAVSITVVNGAEIGGRIAAKIGDVAGMWGGTVAVICTVVVLPMLVAALLNRFGSFRFVLTSFLLTCIFAVSGMFVSFDASLFLRYLPALVLLSMPVIAFSFISCAFAARWKDNRASTACGILFLLSIPVLGNYCLSEALSRGGCISWGYVLLAAVAMLPVVAFFFIFGLCFMQFEKQGE
jgi:ABC-type transport system involved in multi-copper enzyme maturation permease subunit